MAICTGCGKDKPAYELVGDYCSDCRMGGDAKRRAQSEASLSPILTSQKPTPISHILLTTETAHNLPVDRRLDIVTAEVVIGMHVFKDIASAWRDVFGGRSKAMQDGLREARKSALDELRREAHSLGADAVVGVDLDYSEVSGGGKSMLFLVASGTAVTLSRSGG